VDLYSLNKEKMPYVSMEKVDGPHALWSSNVFQTDSYNFEDNLTLIKSLLVFCVSHRKIAF